MNGVLRLFLHGVEEHLGGLEVRNVMLGDNHRRVLRDVASGLLSALLEDEAAKAAEINVLFVGKSALHLFHERFNYCECCCFVNASLLGDVADDFCFCHFCVNDYKFVIMGFITQIFSFGLQR